MLQQHDRRCADRLTTAYRTDRLARLCLDIDLLQINRKQLGQSPANYRLPWAHPRLFGMHRAIEINHLQTSLLQLVKHRCQ